MYLGLLFPLPPTKLVEEKPATSNSQGHLSHNNAHNTFIDNIIEEASNDGKNSPPRFVKEIAHSNNPVFDNPKNNKAEKIESNIQFALPQAKRNSTEISSPFSPDEIASDRDPFENFDILIEEITDVEDSNHPKSKLKQKEVQEVFKSPVTSLTLPAVATKLAKDIDENQKKFKNNGLKDHESPIIDLSNLDIFRSFEPSSYKLLDEEEISIIDGNKRKRNPANPLTSSENQKESKPNDFNDHKPPIIDLSNLDIFSDFKPSPSAFFDEEEEISSFDGNKRKRNPSISLSSSNQITVVVSKDYLENLLYFPNFRM